MIAPRRSEKSALASLRRFLPPRLPDAARCELCSTALADEHAHVVELAQRRLCCACEPCAILFSSADAPKYRRVPRRIERLTEFQMTDRQWAALEVPINLAFFLYSTPLARIVALYPSPAGATEAVPAPEAWLSLVDDNPRLRDLEHDVAALLVNRLSPNPTYYCVGVDTCYALVGLVRKHWNGFSGGTTVWQEVECFFADLHERSCSSSRGHPAGAIS